MLQRELSEQLSDSEVRDWMMKSKFPGSISEARFVFSNIEYDKRLSQTLKEQGIMLKVISN